MRSVLRTAMLFWVAWAASSQAQEMTLQQEATPEGGPPATVQEEEPRRGDPVVVTATMVPTPRERTGATVSVITGDEITLYNYDRIEDALRQVPGVDVQTTGSPGKTTFISIRGGGSQRSLVLVDGMRTGSP